MDSIIPIELITNIFSGVLSLPIHVQTDRIHVTATKIVGNSIKCYDYINERWLRINRNGEITAVTAARGF